MKTRTFLLALSAAFILQGCSLKDKGQTVEKSFKDEVRDSPGSQSVSYKISNETKTSGTSVGINDFHVTDRMIIKSGSINVEIEQYDESEKKIADEVAKAKGFITNTSSSINASGKKQGNVEVRIPADNYDSFIASVNRIGKVMSLNVSGNDVTEEYIDLEARQLTQRELEKRLLNLLNEKTAGLADVVEVEQKLAEVRNTIEATEGRMRYLKNQSSFSTLSISLFEPSLLQTSSGGGFLYELGEAVKKGLNGFTEVFTGLVTFVIALSPVLILILIALLILKKVFSNMRKKKRQLQAQAG